MPKRVQLDYAQTTLRYRKTQLFLLGVLPMRRRLALLLLAYVAVAQSPKASGPTFKLERANLSSPPAFVIYGDMRFTKWRFTGNATSPWARRALVLKIASE